MIIALEGGMCSGKSTIGAHLAREGWSYFPEAIRYLSKKECDTLWGLAGTDDAMRLLLEAEKRRLNAVREIPQDAQILLDRSYYTFLAFEYASKSTDRFNRFKDEFAGLSDVIKPDLIIFLHIDYPERLKRLKNRGDAAAPKMSILHSEGFNDGLREYFHTYYPAPKTILDVSGKTCEQCVEVIRNEINDFVLNKDSSEPGIY